MKKVVLSFCCAVITSVALAYDVVYTYDASGNRIKREPYTEIVQQSMRSLPEKVSTESRIGEISVMYSPNPTKGMLHISVNTDNENVRAIRLYSTTGLLLQQSSGTNNVNFDLSGQQPGIYLLLVDANGENQVFKVVKE